jgi:hypothetical protein
MPLLLRRISIVTLLLTAQACTSRPGNDAGDSGSNDSHPTTSDAGNDDSPVNGPDGATTGPVDVPIAVTEESPSDSMRFSISISVGSASLPVQFDTGSSGLRILSGAVPDQAFSQVTTTPVTYSYHSGLVIQGVVAYANVTIGSLRTPAPIPVMIIQQASCASSNPDCGADGVPLADLTLFGPFKAILGAGMRNTTTAELVGSPIPQLSGEPSFIVKAPSYGGTSGTLELAPPASEIATYKTFSLPLLNDGAPLQNGTPAYDDRFGLPACLDDLTSGVDYCVPAELDTGNPSTYIEWPPHGDAGTTELPPGHQIDVTIGPASSPLEEYTFTVSATPKPGVDVVDVESASGEGFMNLGTVVFFHYDVYFDPEKGLVGFLSH